MLIAAEIKRASPSKGWLIHDLNTFNITQQAMEYASAGASIISVLTNYQYFKGTLHDLKEVRLAMNQLYQREERPLLLRKDFIFDRYQSITSNYISKNK